MSFICPQISWIEILTMTWTQPKPKILPSAIFFNGSKGSLGSQYIQSPHGQWHAQKLEE